MIKWVFTSATAAFLCSCASSGVDVVPVSSTQYAPVPVSSVNVSSHPPKGQYTVIAQLSVTADPNETPNHLIQRLQQKGAAIGADYVMVTSVSDKTFITPENLDTNNNPYLNAQQSFYSTAGSTANNSATYMSEVIKGQALKMTSGSNTPNKAVPPSFGN